MKLGQYLDTKGSNKITVIAVSWLEGRYGADPARLDRVLRREIPPSAYAIQGNETLSALFGTIESVPGYFLYDREGRLVLSQGGGPGEQNRFRLDTGALDKVIGR